MKLRRIDHPGDDAPDTLAEILYRSMTGYPSSFRSEEDAAREVALLANPDRFAIVASDAAGVAGWIGAIMHDHLLWELHPLCVSPERQRQGVGRLLVAELEHEASLASVATLWLGTEDEIGATNLCGRDISGDPLGALSELKLTGPHPIAFYRGLGYTLCGVIPHASGSGLHDFLMCKRITRGSGSA